MRGVAKTQIASPRNRLIFPCVENPSLSRLVARNPFRRPGRGGEVGLPAAVVVADSGVGDVGGDRGCGVAGGEVMGAEIIELGWLAAAFVPP